MNAQQVREATISNMYDMSDEEKIEVYKESNGVARKEIRKNWKACPVKYWNSTTFRSYMNSWTKHLFKIPYVSGNVQQENAMISKFIKDHGKEITKEFIFSCMKGYKPNRDYPYPSFHFMITYMKDGHLPAIYYKHQQAEERRKELEAQKNVDFVDYSDQF